LLIVNKDPNRDRGERIVPDVAGLVGTTGVRGSGDAERSLEELVSKGVEGAEGDEGMQI
jgi:hypothetical protein